MKPPQKPKIILEDNTFINIGTAVKTRGAIDIIGKYNKFTDVGTVIDSDISQNLQNEIPTDSRHWHERPVGKVVLAVTAMCFFAGIAWAFVHFNIPAWFGF